MKQIANISNVNGIPRISEKLPLYVQIVKGVLKCLEENHCKDPASWKQWDDLVAKSPDDMDIQTLHALRLGLCAKVERGDLTVHEATTIFESARDIIINRKKPPAGKESKGL